MFRQNAGYCIKYFAAVFILVYLFASLRLANAKAPLSAGTIGGAFADETATPIAPPYSTPAALSTELILPPQGLYDSCWIQQDECVNHLDVLAAKGFKLILNYGHLYGNSNSHIAYADRAHSLGMKIIWSLNYTSDWTDDNLLAKYPDLAAECECADNIGFITYFVKLIQNHPATWGYYLADEVPAKEHDRLKVYSDLIKNLDPVHPRLIIVAGSNDPMELFFTFPSSMKDTVDMMGPCYYPYGYIDTGSNLTRYTGKAADTADYWANKLRLQPAIVLQAFSQIRYTKVPLCFPWPDCAPFPSFEQMKAQRDQTLLNAKPSIILWWTYQDILKTDNPSKHLDDLAAAAFSPLPDPESSSASPLSECPINWNCEDIGAPTLMGSQTLIDGIWNIEGSGWDIQLENWVRADQFRFVWQNFSDGELSVKVLSQTNTDSAAKAGLMIRKTFDPISPYYAVYVTPRRGVRVQYRADFAKDSQELAAVPETVPVFLKITKNGTSYSAYTSSDGDNWSFIPHSTIPLANLDGLLMGGLAVTSRNENALSTATFDRLIIGPSSGMAAQTDNQSKYMVIVTVVIVVALLGLVILLFRKRFGRSLGIY